MYLREKEGFHPFGDEAASLNVFSEDDIKLFKKLAYNAGFDAGYHGIETAYDPDFKEDWERGFRAGEAAAMAE